MAKEKPKEDLAAHLKLIPHEAALWAGDSVTFELRSYDKNGRFLGKVKEKALEVQGLEGAKLKGYTLETAKKPKTDQGGYVTVKAGDLTAKARVRVFPKLPWKYDFEGFKGKRVPPAWIRAFLKLQPVEIDGSTVLRSMPGG